MIRINLLPQEIGEKRRAERIRVYLVFGALGLYALVFLFFMVTWVRVSIRQTEVDAKVQQAQSLQMQASSFAVFEQRQSDLVARQATADRALASRVEWSRLFNEISLVLPSDVWLTTLSVDEKVLAMTGRAMESQGDVTSMGFKPIARLLVRMTDLEQLQNVWLDNSSRAQVGGAPVVEFTVGADISKPDQKKAASVPAPPSKP